MSQQQQINQFKFIKETFNILNGFSQLSSLILLHFKLFNYFNISYQSCINNININEMMINAYTVQDPVNKYRHGVLIGNFVEDKFGKDLHEKGPLPDAPKQTTTKDHHDLNHSLYQKNQFINSQQPNQSHFYETSKNFKNQSYQRPEHEASYNIFHNQQVKKQVPVLENNPKRQQKLSQQGKLYQHTRYYLSNKFIKQASNQANNEGINQQIPDILTGQIFKSKVQTGSQIKPQQKGKTKIETNINAKAINPFGTYTVVKPQIQRFQQVQYNKFVYPHHKGQHRDVLFGHGLNLEDFQRRQLTTTYDLSFNQKVMPQTQVNSFYEPNKTQAAKQFHRETFYQKNHQQTIPSFGEKKILGQQKAGRPYQPYTGTFDYNHLKNEYLRK